MNLSLELWQKFALAMLTGLLVGLEREHSHLEKDATHFAGIRTFPLIALFGCAVAWFATDGFIWFFAIGFAGLFCLVLIVYAVSALQGGFWNNHRDSSIIDIFDRWADLLGSNLARGRSECIGYCAISAPFYFAHVGNSY
ncbi:MgtC/SapB family protein [Chloroflexota bacterium]